MNRPKQIQSADGVALLDRVRSLCSGWPRVVEAEDRFGHTSFRVSDRPFVILGEDSAGPSLSLKSDPATQAVLLRTGRYRRTPYIGHHGWVSVEDAAELGRTSGVRWMEVADLVEDAFRRVAPKAAVRELDRGP